eukprot:gene5002-5243_t
MEETRKMINMFRLLAGVTPISLTNATMNELAAQAALLFVANSVEPTRQPSEDWRCRTKAALDGVDRSNLAARFTGARAVMWYMQGDAGLDARIGARRLLLRPDNKVMGTGDAWPPAELMLAEAGYFPVNAIWTYDDIHLNKGNLDPSPAASRGYTTWPPGGTIPHILVYQHWHISVEGFPGSGALQNADVAMTCNGTEVYLIVTPGNHELGDVIVWRPFLSNLQTDVWIQSPNVRGADLTCTVIVFGVDLTKYPTSTITYEVTIFYADGSLPGLLR